MHEFFHRFAHRVSGVVGSPFAFAFAFAAIIFWALMGPLFGFSTTWQLLVNTGTTILTFLMVFLIQNTQNRDAKAVHLKLDELIRAAKNARDTFVDAEDLSDHELAALEEEFRAFRAAAIERARVRESRRMNHRSTPPRNNGGTPR